MIEVRIISIFAHFCHFHGERRASAPLPIPADILGNARSLRRFEVAGTPTETRRVEKHRRRRQQPPREKPSVKSDDSVNWFAVWIINMICLLVFPVFTTSVFVFLCYSGIWLCFIRTDKHNEILLWIRTVHVLGEYFIFTTCRNHFISLSSALAFHALPIARFAHVVVEFQRRRRTLTLYVTVHATIHSLNSETIQKEALTTQPVIYKTADQLCILPELCPFVSFSLLVDGLHFLPVAWWL